MGWLHIRALSLQLNDYGAVSPKTLYRRCAIIAEWRRGRMQYSVVVLGATGNVGGRIVQLLIADAVICCGFWSGKGQR